MRALVCTQPNEVQLQHLPRPRAAPGGVVLRTSDRVRPEAVNVIAPNSVGQAQ